MVLSFVVNAQVFPFSLVLGGIPVGTVALIMVIAGFVMSFVFSNYEGNIIKSILESLKNIVSVLLGDAIVDIQFKQTYLKGAC